MNLTIRWEKGSEAAKPGSNAANLLESCKVIIERVLDNVPKKFMSKKLKCWETSTLATAAGEGANTSGLDCEWYVSTVLAVDNSRFGIFLSYKDTSMGQANKDSILIKADKEVEKAILVVTEWFKAQGK